MQRIGAYTVERKLGEGGMGTVYLARSRGGRAVAVKVARPELAQDAEFRRRFHAEVDAARKVGGFHTAPVVDADPSAEEPWLATAYIPGLTLAQLVAQRGPLAPEALRRLGAGLAEALAAIHACGLVHRDLKPGNIIMAEDGPRVLDFGIVRAVEASRLTMTGMAFGTPGYLAPEQAEGGAVDGAADVFALGAVLVAAAGGNAFGGGTPVMLMYRSVHQEADLTALPHPLRPPVAACLEKDPERRPTTGQLLDEFAVDEAPNPASYTPTMQAPPPPSYPPTVTARPHGAPERSTAQESEFLAMDTKNAVVADAQGISLGVDGRSTDLTWRQIASVHSRVARRSTGLAVFVTATDGNTHQCTVLSQNREEAEQWVGQLKAVLTLFLPGF
ncbi:serine/threonine-protein kinase [Streptomyces sp. NPDC054796]